MRSLSPLTSPLFLLTVALSGCSSSPKREAVAGAGTPPTQTAAPARSPGTAVDSLNGLPGHPYGRLVSTYHGLMETDPEPNVRVYYLPATSSEQVTWFAKHRKDIPGFFYKFRDGQLAGFAAIAYSAEGQAALARQARYLFGPGEAGVNQTQWVGQRAWAILSTPYDNGQKITRLDLTSTALKAAQESRLQAQTRAENAAQ